MSLKKHILANYASQLYVTTAGIVMVPLYIKYMGAEAYGLVGFFTMVQAWFNLLDMGLTPTIARETARFKGGALDVMGYRRLTRALEGVFLTIASLGGFALFVSAGWVASHWLNANELPPEQLTTSLQLMAIIISLRWMSGLYRGVISGAERLVWLGGFNAAIATTRFIVILPVLMFVSRTPSAFFGFQLVVALLEISGLALMAYRILPAISTGQRIKWEWSPLKPVLKFSLSIAFTSSVWIMVTQVDKLVLSKILPLEDFAYFTVAVLVASSVAIMSGPISGAIMPRMSRLQAEGEHEQLIDVYRQATRLVTVIAIPIAVILAFFSRQVLWAWTGDNTLTDKAAPVLTLYAAGYGVLAVSSFPYYLQYAKGDLMLHLRGNLLFALVLIPSIIVSADHYGMLGAGWAWLASNSLYMLLWTPLVHRRFAPGLHMGWLLKDVAFPTCITFLLVYIAVANLDWSHHRLLLGGQLIAVSVVLAALTYFLVGRIKLLLPMQAQDATSRS